MGSPYLPDHLQVYEVQLPDPESLSELGEICLRVMEDKETYQGFVLKVKDRMKGLIRGHLSGKIKKALAGA